MPSGFSISANYRRKADGLPDLYLFTPAQVSTVGTLKITIATGIFTGTVQSYVPGVGQVSGQVSGEFEVTDSAATGKPVGTKIACRGTFEASKMLATVRLDAPGQGIVIDEAKVPYVSGNLNVRIV